MFKQSLTMPALILASAAFSFTISISAGAQSLSGLHAKVKLGNKTCFASHEHTGFGKAQGSKRSAVKAAVRDWTSFTKLEYGSQWSNFRRAHGRRMACSQHGNSWSCKVIALPCRS